MNCFNHIKENAVASCQDCQKGLCTTCASLFSFPICRDCNKRRQQSEKKAIYKELFLMFVFGCVGYYLFSQFFGHHDSANLKTRTFSVVLSVLFGFYAGGALVAGWKTLTYITPSVFLFLPLVGWGIYFIVKFLLSIAVGVVMFPVRLLLHTRKLLSLKRL
ncbi:hypothetical protein [Aquimarina longa]|uniref:hypothetical protein n=1 Tax=Aquimarina longa TaxID=1080221 RepID=UPI0007840DCE|nr:hypothetical protein [Aquimarina longa]